MNCVNFGRTNCMMIIWLSLSHRIIHWIIHKYEDIHACECVVDKKMFAFTSPFSDRPPTSSTSPVVVYLCICAYYVTWLIHRIHEIVSIGSCICEACVILYSICCCWYDDEKKKLNIKKRTKITRDFNHAQIQQNWLIAIRSAYSTLI